VLVGSVENSYDQVVFARPGTATRFEQLKGKRFGISGFGSATHNAALILFKKFNLGAEQRCAVRADRHGAGAARSHGHRADRRDFL